MGFIIRSTTSLYHGHLMVLESKNLKKGGGSRKLYPPLKDKEMSFDQSKSQKILEIDFQR